MGFNGVFRVIGQRAPGRLVYSVEIIPTGSSSPTERYSGLSERDLLREARRHQNYRSEFYGPTSRIEDDVKRAIRH